jgi:hypothetical protein
MLEQLAPEPLRVPSQAAEKVAAKSQIFRSCGGFRNLKAIVG